MNSGVVTKDLAGLMEGVDVKQVNSLTFIQTIRQHLEQRLG